MQLLDDSTLLRLSQQHTTLVAPMSFVLLLLKETRRIKELSEEVNSPGMDQVAMTINHVDNYLSNALLRMTDTTSSDQASLSKNQPNTVNRISRLPKP